MIYNKWKYGTNEVSDETNITLAAKYLDEHRIGGQIHFDSDNNLGSNMVYGQTVDVESGEVYGRLSQITGDESQMKAFLTGSFFNQVSYYGTTVYNGKQRNLFVNAIYEFPVFEKSYLRFGASYKYEKIDEDIRFLSPVQKTYAGNYLKEESVPGIFSETSTEFRDLNLSLIGGFRLDFHNEHDVIATPRILVRYQLTDMTVVRASFGTGFRIVNLFSEYPSILASGKDVIFNSKINPERMVNYGVDVLQYIEAGPVTGNVNLDFYRTDFSNKVLPEYDVVPSTVAFLNFRRAASNVLQIESNLTVFRNIEFKLAYKFIDQYYYNNQGIKTEQPFNAKHRILSGLTYSPTSKSWTFNFTLHWLGKQKLPSTQFDPVQYQRPLESDAYTLINGQFTKNFSSFEAYFGIENILDFTQKEPIISANDPFGKYFDTSFVWGPTRGREFYLGFRFSLQ
jgi:outer membrane receptor for ferrienterochelin and colicin